MATDDDILPTLTSIFDFCEPETECQTTPKNVILVYFPHHQNGGHPAMFNPIAVTTDTQKIIPTIHEYLSLLRRIYYPRWANVYHAICQNYATLTQSVRQHRPMVHVTEPCINITPCFGRGTVHGFAFFFSFLRHYFDDADWRPMVQGRRPVMHKHTLRGIRELFSTLFTDDEILWINDDEWYHFSDIVLPANHYHNLLHSQSSWVRQMIEKYVLSRCPTIPLAWPLRGVCLLKTSQSVMTTSCDTVHHEAVVALCNRTGRHVLYEPGDQSELMTIAYLRSVENCIMSWGSAFMKNMLYLTHRCRVAHVLIMDANAKQYNPCDEEHSEMPEPPDGTCFVYHRVTTDISSFSYVFDLPHDFNPYSYRLEHGHLAEFSLAEVCKKYLQRA